MLIEFDDLNELKEDLKDRLRLLSNAILVLTHEEQCSIENTVNETFEEFIEEQMDGR